MALKMEFEQEVILNTNRIMHQGAGEPDCTRCFFSWAPFNLIFLVLEFNEGRNMFMKLLNVKSNGIVLCN